MGLRVLFKPKHSLVTLAQMASLWSSSRRLVVAELIDQAAGCAMTRTQAVGCLIHKRSTEGAKSSILSQHPRQATGPASCSRVQRLSPMSHRQTRLARAVAATPLSKNYVLPDLQSRLCDWRECPDVEPSPHGQ